MTTVNTRYGVFLRQYRALKKHGMLVSVPVILSEGDSWFSTPLYPNLLDCVANATRSAIFSRMEKNGDLALAMFRGANLKDIRRRLHNIPFDLLLLSAGGNDLVDSFLQGLFNGAKPMTVDDAVNRVLNTGRLEKIGEAYRRVVTVAVEARPGLKVVGHTYDYPRLMGEPARLTVEQIGLIALFKRSVGDWIGRHIRVALPEPMNQQAFARVLIDHFHDVALKPVQDAFPDHFRIVNLRGVLTEDAQWNDEMHPSREGFERLSGHYRDAIRALLPPDKRPGI